MRNTLLALATAATVATGAMTAPAQAQWWVLPVIISGAVVGGTAVAVAATSPRYYEPAGTVYVRPTGARQCFIEQRAVAGAWRQVQVCY